jgi:hypothetical protein
MFKKKGTSLPFLTTMMSQISWVKSEETSQVLELPTGERTFIFMSSTEDCKLSFVGHFKQCMEMLACCTKLILEVGNTMATQSVNPSH